MYCHFVFVHREFFMTQFGRRSFGWREKSSKFYRGNVNISERIDFTPTHLSGGEDCPWSLLPQQIMTPSSRRPQA